MPTRLGRWAIMLATRWGERSEKGGRCFKIGRGGGGGADRWLKARKA